MASRWLPVQKVTPPSDAISTNRWWTTALRTRPRRDRGEGDDRRTARRGAGRRRGRGARHTSSSAASGRKNSMRRPRQGAGAGGEAGASISGPVSASRADRRRRMPRGPSVTAAQPGGAAEREHRVELLAQRIGRHPHQRREERGDPGGRGGGAIAGGASHQAGEDQDAGRAEDGLHDLDRRRCRGRQAALARRSASSDGERGQEQRIAGGAAEPLDVVRRRRVAGQLGREAAALGDVGGERQVLALVVRQRLAGPVAEAEGEAQQQPDGHRQPRHRVHGVSPRCDARSAEICSETSPTRKMITANMSASTAPFGMWRSWKTFQTP